jgi:catechol 2,3-dioxygenase-like lactoylglutathione lyase family enzyme
MDYETVDAMTFGASLRGLRINLLVPDVAAEVAFLTGALGMTAHRVSADFAIVIHGADALQLHADGTYHSHPLLGLVPETPPRGAGASLHAFESDPDRAHAAAPGAGGMVLQAPANKPHGVRETCILSPCGYAWTASRPLTPAEQEALS